MSLEGELLFGSEGMAKTTNSGLDLPFHHGFIHGESEGIQCLNTNVGQIAQTEISVLLVGESGTGKEAYARLIHNLSSRSRFPLKKVSCTALESGQLLSQLRSYLQAACGGNGDNPGTLFLDGINELDLPGQKLLLSLLPDENSGEDGEKHLRLISSTSQDLEVEVASGRFRCELYFRINGVRLHLPPLRERKEDIPAFMDYFLAKHSADLIRPAPVLDKEEMELLMAYDWPGNIRELGNLARNMVALGSPKVALVDLRTRSRAAQKAPRESQTLSLKTAARAASRQVERQLIFEALERTHWNRKRAAQELQISYKSLLYKIKQAGVDGMKVRER